MKKYIGLFIVLAIISGCASAPTETHPQTAEELYNEAYALLERTSYQRSAETFEKLELEYPYSKWSTKAKLMGAYAYYKDEKATAEVLKDGWLFTGDMASEDKDGFIYLVDRKKDVIISGGENIYPVQIEDFLRKCDKISDVAVIGLPDARLGEIATAIIQIKDGMTATEEEINDFCLELPRYKRPHKVIFADVPRNPTGKIEKPKLREIYCGDSVVAQQNEIK